ncbi:MAG: type II toxin-antitoxin system RelE/ParE family toxin [Planctomycetota bacterium]|nr:type II toxin-antitoxin system RelE/ParE family toxin [Planctomycetota bacterium]
MLKKRDQATILDRIQSQLSNEPTQPSKNRKPMRPNGIAPWELRIGKFRVYYDVVRGEEPSVEIVAIGVKDRNRVSIGGEVVEL